MEKLMAPRADTGPVKPGEARPSGQGAGPPALHQRAIDEVRRLVGAGADLVLARGCAGCGAARVLWCAVCAGTFGDGPFVAWPTPAPLGLPPPYAAARYEGPVRSALLAHKEDGRLALARPLGAALASAISLGALQAGLVRPSSTGGHVGRVRLVPAPSRRSAVRARGQDATLRLARAAAARLRLAGFDAVVLPVVRPARGLRDQAGLSAANREANLEGALHVRADLGRLVAGRSVVVVDDVVTTGSTLAEAARALHAAGADVEIVATVAATVRRSGPH